MQPDLQNPQIQQTTQPLASAQVPTLTTRNHDHKNLFITLLVSLAVFLVGLIIFIIIFFDLLSISSIKIGGLKFTNSYAQLPLNLDQPGILRSYFIYELRGKIQEIKNTPQGTEVVSSIVNKGRNLAFIVNDKTIVNIYQNSTPTPGNISNLQTGQTVDIVGQYQIKENIWIAKAILINEFATASAQLKN